MAPYKEVKESHIIEAIWDDHLRRENGTELSLSGKNEAKTFSNLTPSRASELNLPDLCIISLSFYRHYHTLIICDARAWLTYVLLGRARACGQENCRICDHVPTYVSTAGKF